jgi:NAD(P)-dependent dehydrogenase (short-subunit alcohol dehydrogenase family)|tara:strand:+ start:1207 stop:2049 length:843 start_codon:yes stop_codon:yes gene_type:complete
MKNKDYLNNIFSLKDKVIVVTGASGLLGKMHVEAIASQGGIPVIVDINEDGLNEVYSYILSEYSIECFIEIVDITNEGELLSSSLRIIEKYGKIDGLVNNAARNPSISKDQKINFNRLESFDRKAWDLDLSVGVTGSFLCIKYYGYQISLNENGGSIVNISSDLGIIAPDQRIYEQEGLDKDKQPVKPISYSVVKSALLGLSRYVATYWASENVRSNCLLPGGVKTDQDDVFINKLTNLIPLKRMAKNNEYQAAIIFLLSDASSYMTGTNLIMDGGRSSW